MSYRTIALTLGMAGLFTMVEMGTASAQNPPPKPRAARPGKTIRLGEFKIEGTVQKPQAFYILQRSNLNFEGLELKNSFVPKIVQSVEQAPF